MPGVPSRFLDEVSADLLIRPELPRTAISVEPEEDRTLPELVVGDRVRHATFGEGRVLAVEGEGIRAVITVQFTQGVKRLALGYAPLERA